MMRRTKKTAYSNREKRRGFTLLEMIVYVSIIAIIFIVVVNTVLLVSTAWGNARVKRNIIQQGGSAMERMLREVRLADSVDTDFSTFGAHPGALRLNTIISPDNVTPVTREFLVSTSSIIILREDSLDTALTTDVDITNLVFYYSANSDISESVSIRMTVEDGVGRFSQAENFYGTAVLRRSY